MLKEHSEILEANGTRRLHRKTTHVCNKKITLDDSGRLLVSDRWVKVSLEQDFLSFYEDGMFTFLLKAFKGTVQIEKF
jgi:hypothetical protein